MPAVASDAKALVYTATCKTNSKVYIGITTNSLCRRSKRHMSDALKGSSVHFHQALRKHGFDTFVWEVRAQGLTWGEACSLERQLIQELGTLDRSKGYNKTGGGEGSFEMSVSSTTRAKISATLKVWHASGDVKAQALRTKVSKLRKETPVSQGTRKKLATASRKRVLSEDSRLKISASKQLYPEKIRKAAVEYALENGFHAASRHFDIPRQTVRRWSKTRDERSTELEKMRQRAREKQYGYAFPLVSQQ